CVPLVPHPFPTRRSSDLLEALDPQRLAPELGIGVPTLRDIIEALLRPGRDPREDLPPPIFRTDVLKIEDLKPGMELVGTVRNVRSEEHTSELQSRENLVC